MCIEVQIKKLKFRFRCKIKRFLKCTFECLNVIQYRTGIRSEIVFPLLKKIIIPCRFLWWSPIVILSRNTRPARLFALGIFGTVVYKIETRGRVFLVRMRQQIALVRLLCLVCACVINTRFVFAQRFYIAV